MKPLPRANFTMHIHTLDSTIRKIHQNNKLCFVNLKYILQNSLIYSLNDHSKTDPK